MAGLWCDGWRLLTREAALVVYRGQTWEDGEELTLHKNLLHLLVFEPAPHFFMQLVVVSQHGALTVHLILEDTHTHNINGSVTHTSDTHVHTRRTRRPHTVSPLSGGDGVHCETVVVIY